MTDDLSHDVPDSASASGADKPAATPAEKQKRTAIFRWRGIIPLLLIVALVAAGWVMFSGRILRNLAVEATTEVLGTHVDIASVDLDVRATRITVR